METEIEMIANIHSITVKKKEAKIYLTLDVKDDLYKPLDPRLPITITQASGKP